MTPNRLQKMSSDIKLAPEEQHLILHLNSNSAQVRY
jgi:hypothetical protein